MDRPDARSSFARVKKMKRGARAATLTKTACPALPVRGPEPREIVSRKETRGKSLVSSEVHPDAAYPIDVLDARHRLPKVQSTEPTGEKL